MKIFEGEDSDDQSDDDSENSECEEHPHELVKYLFRIIVGGKTMVFVVASISSMRAIMEESTDKWVNCGLVTSYVSEE